MTVSKAGSLRAGRTSPMRAGALGLAIGLVATFSGAQAADPAAVSGVPLQMLQVAGVAAQSQAVTVTDVDFKRGDGGSGKLILRFDGDGATPDLRTQDGSVVVNLGGATCADVLALVDVAIQRHRRAGCADPVLEIRVF